MSSCVARSRARRHVGALDLGAEHGVLQDGAPLEQVVLLQHVADLAGRPGDRRAVDQHGAVGRLEDAGDQRQQRALAAAALADDGDELARRDRERDVLERLGLALEAEIAQADVAQLDLRPGRRRRVPVPARITSPCWRIRCSTRSSNFTRLALSSTLPCTRMSWNFSIGLRLDLRRALPDVELAIALGRGGERLRVDAREERLDRLGDLRRRCAMRSTSCALVDRVGPGLDDRRIFFDVFVGRHERGVVGRARRSRRSRRGSAPCRRARAARRRAR